MAKAKAKPKPKPLFERLDPDVIDKWAAVEGNQLPQTFIAGRAVNMQLATLQRHLFTALEEAESPNYLIYELRRSVQEVDFAGFTLAVCQTLYNQSYLSKNQDVNSGLERRIDKGLQEQTGQNFFGGTICITLSDLCRLAYGVKKPDTTQRQKMSSIIDILKNNSYPLSIPITDNKGVVIDRMKIKDTLVFPIREAERESDGAKYYVLYLHPIFCNMAQGFLEAPQDITNQLATAVKETGTTRTAAQYHLLRVLLLHRVSPNFPPLIRYTKTLLEELGLVEAYQDQPTRTEKQLIETCKVMVKMGIITHFEEERGKKGRRKSALIKITFHYDPNYIRKEKTNEQGQKAIKEG